jgi:hypothetical protein
MVALEQMKKMQNKELEENEIASEVEKLEKKYQDMQTNWADYANQAKNQIQELKTSIEIKKKNISINMNKLINQKKK